MPTNIRSTSHRLQWTYNSFLAAAGIPLTTAQKLMKHSDPNRPEPKRTARLNKKPAVWRVFEKLGIQDSNLDYLIQSQACYRYTNPHFCGDFWCL